MAELLNTTINGDLKVSDGISTKNGICLLNDSGQGVEMGIDSNGDGETVFAIKTTKYSAIENLDFNGKLINKPHILYHNDTQQEVATTAYEDSNGTTYWYLHPHEKAAETSRLGSLGYRWGIVYGVQGNFSGEVTLTNNSLCTSNGCGVASKNSTGEKKSLIYMSTGNNLHIGQYDNNNLAIDDDQILYLNAQKGAVALRSLKGNVWLAYNKNPALHPGTNGALNLGYTGYRWKDVYVTGGVKSSSDMREKNTIISVENYSQIQQKPLLEKLYKELKPVTYYFNNKEDSQLHIGFIAQDIAKTMEKLKMKEDGFAFLSHDSWIDEETGEEKDRYSIAYSEFIALNTYMIQKQQAIIEALEKRVTELEEVK